MREIQMVNIRSIIKENVAASCFFRSSVEPPHRKALLRITDRCNLHCVDCFISAGDYGDTMPVEAIEETVIPRLKQCRVYNVTLTGGEPFLHRGIIKIVQLLRDANMRVGICTNGTLITSEQMEMLSTMGNVHVNVSLHGFKPESHNRFTGDNTAFQRTVSNIKQLSEHKLLQGLLVTPNRFAQVEEYEKMCEFAIQNKASYVLMNPLSSLGRGVKSKKKAAAPYETMCKIKTATSKFNNHIQIVYIRFPNDRLPLASCEAGNIIYVLVNGDVAICAYLVFATETPNSKHDTNEFIVGNILHHTDIAERLDNYKLCDRYILGNNEECKTCHLNDACGKGCPAAVIASGKQIGAIDSEVCPIVNSKMHKN
jgi:radical SAM protein with 4Fe4S-binding SPASM domain